MMPKEFENLTVEAMVARVQELKQAYFELKANVASGKEKNTASLKQAKRLVAQALTALERKTKVASS